MREGEGGCEGEECEGDKEPESINHARVEGTLPV